MAIGISNAPVTPELVFDRVFMERLSIEQERASQQGDHPLYRLTVSYRLFAVDPEGKRHYQSKIDTVKVDDYAAVALEKALAGDMDLAQAMQAIEFALAKILDDMTDLNVSAIS